MSDVSEPAEQVVIAVLVENSEFSTGGVVAIATMSFVAVITFTGTFVGSMSAIQQSAVALIGLVVMAPLGVAAAIGRRRSYKVFREVRPDEKRP